jgi:hypothetical protein
MGAAVGPWPWVPVLNLALPFHLAGRSRIWAAALLLPPVNLIVWALVWGELAARQGRRGPWGLWLTLTTFVMAGTVIFTDTMSDRLMSALSLLMMSFLVLFLCPTWFAPRPPRSWTSRPWIATPEQEELLWAFSPFQGFRYVPLQGRTRYLGAFFLTALTYSVIVGAASPTRTSCGIPAW